MERRIHVSRLDQLFFYFTNKPSLSSPSPLPSSLQLPLAVSSASFIFVPSLHHTHHRRSFLSIGRFCCIIIAFTSFAYPNLHSLKSYLVFLLHQIHPAHSSRTCCFNFQHLGSRASQYHLHRLSPPTARPLWIFPDIFPAPLWLRVSASRLLTGFPSWPL